MLAGPVLAIRLLELAAVAGRSADVRSVIDAAAVRDPLAGAVPPALVLARRTTVHVDDRRRRPVATDGFRVRDIEERGNLAAHGPWITHVDRLDQRLRIDARGQRAREWARLGHAPARDVNVPRLARSGEDVRREVAIRSGTDGCVDARA